MTGKGSSSQPRRWVRLRPDYHPVYPVTFHDHWLRILDNPHPDVPSMPGYVWLDLAGTAQQVEAAHFEIVERSRQRILVVDDDATIRHTLQIGLKKRGYEVLQAPDGEEATHLWREAGPDLIIADIHMPRKSGLLLMQELQANLTSTRVIAMTDGGPARRFDLVGLAELLGAVRSVAKPFTLEQMVAAVDEELDRST